MTKRSLFVVLCIVVAGCESPSEKAEAPPPVQRVVRTETEPKPVAPLTGADAERVCKAALQAMNGQTARSMKSLTSKEEGIERVTYNRSSDGKKWTYDCRSSDGTVNIRPVDALGPGSGPGSWWSSTRIGYQLAPDKVTIITQYEGEEALSADIAI